MKVFNKRAGNAPRDAIYVGRPTRWGNPFSHLDNAKADVKVASRAEAVARYRQMLMASPDLIAAARLELKGKHLVCWCAPLACHADVLLEVANSEEP